MFNSCKKNKLVFNILNVSTLSSKKCYRDDNVEKVWHQ